MLSSPYLMDPAGDTLADAEHMFARRRRCCFFVPSAGPSVWWQRIRTPAGASTETDTWWQKGLDALRKVREWSELVAGPRWKTFIRRFRRRGGKSSGPGRFRYDPTSYARNFDEGADDDSDGEYGSYRGFSARYASLPASAKTSMDLGGRDAPPLVVERVVTEKIGS